MISIILTASQAEQMVEHKEEWSTVLGDSLVIFISFIILLYILNRFAIGPVLDMFEQREKTVNDQLDRAEQLEKEAVTHEQVAKDMISQAQTTSQQLVTRAKETSEQLKEKASQETRQEISRMRAEAEKSIANEREVVMSELTHQVGDLSVALTQRLLKRQLTVEDHQQFINEFIEGLEK